MSVVNMSVHRGLAELKLLGNKIERGVNNTFVVANKVSNKNIGGRTIEEAKNSIQGNFDSIVDLIENRKRIKSALVKSNASTVVSISGKEYTVAEAIERKASVALDRMFLNALRLQFARENNAVESQNATLSSKLETYLASVLGEKSSRSPEDVKQHTKVFEDLNRFELIDPKKVANYIEKLQEEIDNFESEVDYVLSESNATTFFDVDLVN